MIVEPVGLVVGDDNRALAPIRAGRDCVDLLGEQSFADLRIRIAGVVVVAAEDLCQLRVRIDRLPVANIAVAAAHIEDARRRQLLFGDRVKEFA